MSQTTPTLAGLIRSLLEARTADLHVALPAKVESFDPIRQAADVQPEIKRKLASIDGAPPEIIDLPKLVRVPVVYPRGAGWRISWPLEAGDTVLVVFAERAIDAWLGTGRRDAPPDNRRHALTDAVAIPGLSATPAALPGLDRGLVIGREDGSAEIHLAADGTITVTAGALKLGSADATLEVARRTDPTVVDGSTDAAFVAWMAAVDAGLKAGAGPAAGITTAYNGALAAAGGAAPTAVQGKITAGSAKVVAE